MAMLRKALCLLSVASILAQFTIALKFQTPALPQAAGSATPPIDGECWQTGKTCKVCGNEAESGSHGLCLQAYSSPKNDLAAPQSRDRTESNFSNENTNAPDFALTSSRTRLPDTLISRTTGPEPPDPVPKTRARNS